MDHDVVRKVGLRCSIRTEFERNTYYLLFYFQQRRHQYLVILPRMNMPGCRVHEYLQRDKNDISIGTGPRPRAN